MDFNIYSFTDKLLTSIYESEYFPYMDKPYIDRYGRVQSDKNKHPKREPTHLRKIVGSEMRSTLLYSDNKATFDLGSERLEKEYPYYHILQDTPVIRKAYRGTDESRGTQMYEKNIGKRDYGRVDWNGKTFTKEYSKVVNIKRTTFRVGNRFFDKGAEAEQYLNVHYQYLDRICKDVAPVLAEIYNLHLVEKQDSGLIDEFADQEGVSVDLIHNIFDSFMEE